MPSFTGWVNSIQGIAIDIGIEAGPRFPNCTVAYIYRHPVYNIIKALLAFLIIFTRQTEVFKSNRIRRQIPSNPRIVIPVPVVMQAGLLIVVLPWESDVVGDVDSVAVRVVVHGGFAEGVVVGLPGDYGAAVGQHLRSAEVVVDVIINIFVGAA